MFTGIIETMVPVLSRTGSQLILRRPECFTSLQNGQSIAVNGACLSIVEYDDVQMIFDVVPETFLRTNLALTEHVNLERAMRADGRFEGHIVLGHIDGVVSLLERRKQESGEIYVFAMPSEFTHCLLEKGSVALNGVSLTLAAVSFDCFSVALIPQTIVHTNFDTLLIGGQINIEMDYIAKIHSTCQL